MPMIACPGCGLPREDGQVGVVPCPVCASGTDAETPSQPLLFAAEIPADPTAALPADAGQMETFPAASRSPSWFPIAAAFGVGVAVGVGGLLVGQGMTIPGRPETVARLDSASHVESGLPFAPPVTLAPMPREHRTIAAAPIAKPEPKAEPIQWPKLAPDLPALGRVEPIHLNQPDAAYTLPRVERKGEHIVLRGRVRLLRINGLGSGAILDASGLEAGSIYVCGSIDGGSRLRINCPDGVVELPASVGEHSRVEIHAPGSSVRFVYPTTPERPGSSIAGGASVAITARTVDLRGDVTGAGTTVKITLTRNGSLRAAAVRGAAVVEYRTGDPKAPASAAVVAPTATFKKVD